MKGKDHQPFIFPGTASRDFAYLRDAISSSCSSGSCCSAAHGKDWGMSAGSNSGFGYRSEGAASIRLNSVLARDVTGGPGLQS